MSRYIINSVQFDQEDGVITVTYLDTEEGLRKKGNVFTSKAVSVTPEASALYGQLREVQDDLLDFLVDVEQVYRDDPPFIPVDDDTPDEDDEDKGMGWS